MTQYRVSERNAKRMKAWLAKKTNGDRLLRDKKGNSSWDEWTFDQALGELLTEAGYWCLALNVATMMLFTVILKNPHFWNDLACSRIADVRITIQTKMRYGMVTDGSERKTVCDMCELWRSLSWKVRSTAPINTVNLVRRRGSDALQMWAFSDGAYSHRRA